LNFTTKATFRIVASNWLYVKFFLLDPKDDHILELAFNSKSNYIVTYNTKDFKGIYKLGIKAMKPDEFLKVLGAKR
jgi:predicted nucleic acid-binding protein